MVPDAASEPCKRHGRPHSAKGRRRQEKGSLPAPARDRPMPHDPAFPLPDLFPDHPAAAEDITVLVETAVTLLANLLASEVLAVSWSGGKDSTACVILSLLAMQSAVALRLASAQPVILHGDTLLASPPVSTLATPMPTPLRPRLHP